MIYGLNFNNTPIPPELRRYFAKRISLDRAGAKNPKIHCTLQGIAETEDERDAMLIQADNGHRKLHVETRRRAGGKFLFGIYVC